MVCYWSSTKDTTCRIRKDCHNFYLSSWLSSREYKYSTIKKAIQEGFLKIFYILSHTWNSGCLILLEPDLGTTVVICVTAFAMFIMAGNDRIHTLGSFASILFLPIGILAGILEPYRLKRIKLFYISTNRRSCRRKGSGYQMQQILIGIGSGDSLEKDLVNQDKGLDTW